MKARPGIAGPTGAPRMRLVSRRSLTLLFLPWEDHAPIWVVQVLELGLVSQGYGLADAFAMAVEAVDLVVEDDAADGLDVWGRTPAPAEVQAQAAAVPPARRAPTGASFGDLAVQARPEDGPVVLELDAWF
jgi:predicted RNase H-like HicB family nuclease